QDMITCQKMVKVAQGVFDVGSRFLVFEEMGQHSGGLFRLVGFAKFGQPSERCPVCRVFLDPSGSGVPSVRGANRSDVFTVNVDLKAHDGPYHGPARSALARKCAGVRPTAAPPLLNFAE